MNETPKKRSWRRWLTRPQTVGWRKAVFQVHLWSGVGIGLYVLFISVTGSVLVYRNELYVAALPESADAPADGIGIRLVSTLIDLHDNLLAGSTGRALNGIGALAVLVLAITGIVLWWPGAARWRRSLTLRRGVGWRRFVWDIHSMVGIWSFGGIVVFALSGVYLCFPEAFHSTADRLEPVTDANAGSRVVDRVLYWLAFLHFGRINGIGLPCSGPGLCDQTVKAFWAVAGLTPAAMFVTGTIMWWNRVLRRLWPGTSKR